MSRTVVVGLAGVAILSWSCGYIAAPREPLDQEVQRQGLGAEETRRVLAATVESLRSENRLLVFSYRSIARVEVSKRRLWLLRGRQELLVVSTVNYYVDLSKLDHNSVEYDPDTQTVRIDLPALTMGDVAFHPDEASSRNEGLLTWSDKQVQALTASAYQTARRATIKQAQQKSLVEIVKGRAGAAVAHNFLVPLRAVGAEDIRVQVMFAS